MDLGLKIVAGIVGAVIVTAVVVVLFRTGKPVRALAGSGIQGVCALAAVNVAGAFTSVSLGLNLFSGAVCLVLGIPGVIGLLLLKLIFNMG